MRQGGLNVRLIRSSSEVLASRNLPQAVVDFLFNIFKLFFLLDNPLLLRQQLVFDNINVPVLEKIGNLRQRHIERTQIAHRVENFKLPCAVIAVVRLRVNIFGNKNSEALIVAQTARAEVKIFEISPIEKSEDLSI